MENGMKRDSMVFYRSFFESVEDLEAADFKKCVCSILQYGLDGIEPDVEGISKTVFRLVKPQIDKNNQRYLNGLKGGKPKTNQTETKAIPKETKPKPNVNVNDNVNDLLNKYIASEQVKEKIREWLKYKVERRETYKPTGLNSLIKQIEKKIQELGEQTVIDVIDLSMASGWKGIIWDCAVKKQPKKNTTFSAMDMKQEYKFDDMESQLLGWGEYDDSRR